MTQIADLRNIIPDGKYTLYVPNNRMVRVYDKFMDEVYSVVESEQDITGESSVYHTMGNHRRIFNPDKMLPAFLDNISPGLFHTMTINKGYLLIDDVLDRRAFSIRPDGFHYTFEYSSNGDDFPSVESDSDGVTREYTLSDSGKVILCLQTTHNTPPIELYLVSKDAEL